jgi:L-alanine-DL-glutamate epimerase-like enolase superfamily enzyme
VGQEKNPAAQVADTTSTLRITALRTYWVNPVVFVKIETNHGAVGWGEIKGIDPRVAKVLAEALYPLLDGENPTRIEYLWQKVYRAHRDIRGGPFLVHTLAGLDLALWDLAGKLWGVPVYRLLDGPCRHLWIVMRSCCRRRRNGSIPSTPRSTTPR